MDGKNEHGGNVDKLEDAKLHWMNGSNGKSCRLFVGMMQFVKVFVEPRPVENTVTPVSDVILPYKHDGKLNHQPKVAVFGWIKVDFTVAVIHDPTSYGS